MISSKARSNIVNNRLFFILNFSRFQFFYNFYDKILKSKKSPVYAYQRVQYEKIEGIFKSFPNLEDYD